MGGAWCALVQGQNFSTVGLLIPESPNPCEGTEPAGYRAPGLEFRDVSLFKILRPMLSLLSFP